MLQKCCYTTLKTVIFPHDKKEFYNTIKKSFLTRQKDRKETATHQRQASDKQGKKQAKNEARKNHGKSGKVLAR